MNGDIFGLSGSPDRPQRRPRVAILGGGFAGAATALHLAAATTPDQVEIVVVEPRAALGHGVAYSTDDPQHRINVPATKMALLPDAPDHFAEWLLTERIDMPADATTRRGEVYPQRRIFGRYVAAQLQPALSSGAVRHRRAAAAAVVAAAGPGRMRVDLSDGAAFEADAVVLAMTHPAPALPRPMQSLAGSDRVAADPWDEAAIARVRPDERVLVVGSGLTAADVIASLVARGHHGGIVAVSRHGLRSRGQDVPRQDSAADFADRPASRALELLARVRAAVAADAAAGVTWHAALDNVRTQGREIWAALAPAERARLVRHLRRFWDVHRFRIAPQVEAALDGAVARGRLAFVAASLCGARETREGVVVDWRPRHRHATVSERFDRVVVTTGPDHAAVLRSNAAMRSLAEAGLLRPDPNGLGLLVADHCRAVGADDSASEILFVAGPLARGGVGELMGAVEVTRHAEGVAQRLRRRVEALNRGAFAA